MFELGVTSTQIRLGIALQRSVLFGMDITDVYARISGLEEPFVPALGHWTSGCASRRVMNRRSKTANGQRPLRRLSANWHFNWPTALCFSVSSSLASLVNAVSPGH